MLTWCFFVLFVFGENFNCTSSVLFVGDHSLIQYSLQTILAQGGIHLFLVLGGQFLVSTVYPLAYLVQ